MTICQRRLERRRNFLIVTLEGAKKLISNCNTRACGRAQVYFWFKFHTRTLICNGLLK